MPDFCKTFIPLLAVVLGAGTYGPVALAQNGTARPNTPRRATTNSLPDTRVMFVDNNNVGGLTALRAGGEADAVSLGVSRAVLDKQPAARQTLMRWVAQGGTVFLHTDAAQWFGYRTVAARLTTPRQVGQLFGRARAAVPFGGHRLLWGNATRPVPAPRSLSVRTIYYQMQPGDHLVIDHPAAVGLLNVSDLAAPATTRPLLAAAVAPFGNGWAIFTPRVVETHRADGNAFLGNLSRFAVEVALSSRHRLARRFSDDDVIAVPASLLDNYGKAAGGGQTEAGPGTWSRLLLPGGDDEMDGADPARMPRPAAQVLTTRREIRALSYGLSPEADARAQDASRALLATLRARLALQRNSYALATPWLNQAIQLAPQAAETLWLQGSLAASQGEDIYQPSQVRAAAFYTAAKSWDAALTANSLSEWLLARDGIAPGADPASTNTTAAIFNRARDISGVPREMLGLWRAAANTLGNQARAEPPLAQAYGAAGNPILIRFFNGDPFLPLLATSTQVLSRGSAAVGWRAEDEEALLFPTTEYFGAYRVASGLLVQQTPLPPLGGDISGTRIFMLTDPPPVTIGVGPTIIQQGSPLVGGNVPDLLPAARLSRLHTYVLINTLAGGGTVVPAWMHYGLSGMVNTGVAADLTAASRMDEAYYRSLQSGGLFSPEQFARAVPPINTLTYYEAQGYRVMQFFYNRYGAGRVAETLQRLGAGDSVDEALMGAIGLNEAQFFAAWQQAEQRAANGN